MISTRSIVLPENAQQSSDSAIGRFADKWPGDKWPLTSASADKWPVASADKWPVASADKWPLTSASADKWPLTSASADKWPLVAAV